MDDLETSAVMPCRMLPQAQNVSPGLRYLNDLRSLQLHVDRSVEQDFLNLVVVQGGNRPFLHSSVSNS